MAGFPVRLSPALTAHVRKSAAVLDRSLTEQVEHWARLGQIVEAVISSGAMQRLKQLSYDDQLAGRLACARTSAGRARAADLIHARHAPQHNGAEDGAHTHVTRSGKHARSRPEK